MQRVMNPVVKSIQVNTCSKIFHSERSETRFFIAINFSFALEYAIKRARPERIKIEWDTFACGLP